MSWHRVRRGRAKGFSAEPPPEPTRRPARVAVTLALAHMIQRAIERGRDSEIRRRRREGSGVTRARMTQILDLTSLAPDLQERILSSDVDILSGPPTEHSLRTLVRTMSWRSQRHSFSV